MALCFQQRALRHTHQPCLFRLCSRRASSQATEPAAKQRRLMPPSPARGLNDQDFKSVTRDIKLRNMRNIDDDLQWLRESFPQVRSLRQGLQGLITQQNDNTKSFQKLVSQYKALEHEKNARIKASKEAKVSKKPSQAVGPRAVEEPKLDDASQPDDQAPQADSPEQSGPSSGQEHMAISKGMASLSKSSKALKEKRAAMQSELKGLLEKTLNIRLSMPNKIHPNVPIGPEGKAIVVSVKDPRNILPSEFDAVKEAWNRSVMHLEDFAKGPPPDPTNKGHLIVAEQLKGGLIDMASGTLTTGNSWPYLLGSVSMLEHALSQYALSIAVKRGFTPVSTPDVIKAELADRCGFRPRDEKAKQTYFLASDSKETADDLCLAATAEIPLASLLASTFISTKGAPEASLRHPMQASGLPLKLVALGHAFRAEAGARGSDTRGLYRVHQFTKAEMFVTTLGNYDESNKMLEELRDIQEEVITGLGLAYRVLDMPTEELGASAYRKYDIEAWMPGRGGWGEVSSASNCTDYQARRLATRHVGHGQGFVHTLNATAAAVPRLIIALLENYGAKDGKMVLPSTLKPFWLGGESDSGVEWVSMPEHGKQTSSKQSSLRKAIAKVQEIARRNGTDPASMVASFMILHELTAIIPLVLLFYVFSALGAGEAIIQWLGGEEQAARAASEDEGWIGSRVRSWIQEGMLRAERYGKKNGYFGFEKEEGGAASMVDGEMAEAKQGELVKAGETLNLAGSLANAVAAYAVVKALLPLRIGASIALAGPFSRLLMEPLKRIGRQALAKSKTALAP